MTESMTVMIAPQATRLRIVAHSGRKRLLQALMTPLSPWTLRAVPALLRGLSEYQARPLCVVLCADESGTCTVSDMLRVLQQSTTEWPIGLAVAPSRPHHDADWNRQFDDLQQLHVEGRQP